MAKTFWAVLVLLLGCVGPLSAADSQFTYQGRLEDAGQLAEGAYDVEVRLFDAASGGSLVAGPLSFEDVPVQSGLFLLTIDPGDTAFTGGERWLELWLRRGGESGGYTQLLPRQKVFATPYAQYALDAGFAASVADTSVSTAQLAPGAVTASRIDSSQVQRRIGGECAAGSALRLVTEDGSVVCQALPDTGLLWSRSGNAGTDPANDFLGTTDQAGFEIRTAGSRHLRLEPSLEQLDGEPVSANLLAGSSSNYIAPGVRAGTVSGGGVPADWPDAGLPGPNRVYWDFGTVGGGINNQAGEPSNEFNPRRAATVAGGWGNTASGHQSTVGGGFANTASGWGATIAGGTYNAAPGQFSSVTGGSYNVAAANVAAVLGGQSNQATGGASAIAGGNNNLASGGGSAIIGSQQSTASGGNSMVMTGFRSCAGGLNSVAAGNRAKIRPGSFSGDPGAACDGVPLAASGFGDRNTFVWADSQDADYLSDGADQFNIRARGGVNLHDSTSLSFGSGTRQMLNLFGQNYGIGVQTSTLYFRTNSRFAWFSGGVHANTSLDPGSGGSLLMTLGTTAGTPTGTARAQTFTSVSDRNAKTALEPVDSTDVLTRVLALPLATWSYRNEPNRRHLGPMAQDFHAAFGLGDDERSIAMVDADGVALAAIQGLHAHFQAVQQADAARIAALEDAVQALREELTSLRQAGAARRTGSSGARP